MPKTALPSAHAVPERGHGVDHRATHHRGLDDIGPDDRTNTARRGVDGGQRRHQHHGACINQNGLRRSWGSVMPHLVGQHHDHGRDVEPGSAGKQTCEQEHRRRGIARYLAEAQLEILVNRNDIVVVKRPDKETGDDNAREDHADGQLRVSEVAKVITFARRAEKSGRAEFCRDERAQDRPPR